MQRASDVLPHPTRSGSAIDAASTTLSSGEAPGKLPDAVAPTRDVSSRLVGHPQQAVAAYASNTKIVVAWIVLVLSVLGGTGYVVLRAYGR